MIIMCRLGEGCSHFAAILFKIEYAVRNGYTSGTSNLCSWNQVFTTKVSNKSLFVTGQLFISQFFAA